MFSMGTFKEGPIHLQNIKEIAGGILKVNSVLC